MIIEIGDKLVSDELFTKEFVCNLSACKGICCIEGDEGAPLTLEEVDLLEENIDEIKPFMTDEGRDMVERKGVFYIDQDNEPVTSLIKGTACAFVYRDDEGITKCSIETAFKNGRIEFNKPISCHLYPIRVKKYHSFLSLNYDRWQICSPACALGEELKIPVYRFLKEPLIRVFGADFYADLEKINKDMNKLKEN